GRMPIPVLREADDVLAAQAAGASGAEICRESTACAAGAAAARKRAVASALRSHVMSLTWARIRTGSHGRARTAAMASASAAGLLGGPSRPGAAGAGRGAAPAAPAATERPHPTSER